MNIKITKSSYKTKDNKRAIIYDCSSKNYRKKIKTGLFIPEEYFQSPNSPLSISLKITLDKVKEKKQDALNKYIKNNWTLSQLEDYLRKGINIYSLEEYVKNDFIKNKNLITGNDYLNVIRVFKKHLNKTHIHFKDIMEYENILEFRINALKKGIKISSLNSYLKKMSVIMNQAHRDGFLNRKFELPKYILEKRQKVKKILIFDKNDFVESVNKSNDIFQLQSVSIMCMLIICGGMSPSNFMQYRVINNMKKRDLVGSMIYENDSKFLKFKKSNKGSVFKYVKLDYNKLKIIEIVKILFYITHFEKYPYIFSSFSNYDKIFDFDIQKNHNLYRNIWNFYQARIKEISNLKFRDAKDIYYNTINGIEMNKIVSDILFARLNDIDLISHEYTKSIIENIEIAENKISKLLSVNELIQVIINKSIFLGIDLNKISLSEIQTPQQFSNLIQKINMYHKDL